MPTWKVVGGPREYDSTPEAADIDVGWAYELERGGERRVVHVRVAGGRSGDPALPEESRRAIRTLGRSAVNAVLNRDEPPSVIMVTTAGLREQA